MFCLSYEAIEKERTPLLAEMEYSEGGSSLIFLWLTPAPAFVGGSWQMQVQVSEVPSACYIYRRRILVMPRYRAYGKFLSS